MPTSSNGLDFYGDGVQGKGALPLPLPIPSEDCDYLSRGRLGLQAVQSPHSPSFPFRVLSFKKRFGDYLKSVYDGVGFGVSASLGSIEFPAPSGI